MSLSSKNFVFICLTMITRSYILNIKLVQYRSYSSLYDNKSFSSKYNQKSGSDSSASITKDSIVQQPNQYDIKRMQFQAKLGLSLEDPRFIVNNVNVKKVEVVKTGAELRKERKLQGKNKDKSINKKQNENAKTSDVSTRFILGNGVEGLSVQSLLGLVKSTAPYYFPEMMVKAVVDEDVFFEVDNYYERGTQPHDTTSSDENKQFETPWEQIFHDTEVVFNKKQPNSQAISSEEDRIQYFKLCIASHFATVATYVPTDVDSKIRGHCWNDPSPYVIESQYLHLKDAMLNWNPADVSSRVIFINGDPLSGHDGEWLGTLFGALGAMLRVGNKQYAREIEELIEVELARETSYFRKLYMSKASTQTDTIILKAAAIICHNVGDCDQGLSYWNNATMTNDMQRIFHQYSRLAHERYGRFNGEFGKAKLIYSVRTFNCHSKPLILHNANIIYRRNYCQRKDIATIHYARPSVCVNMQI